MQCPSCLFTLQHSFVHRTTLVTPPQPNRPDKTITTTNATASHAVDGIALCFASGDPPPSTPATHAHHTMATLHLQPPPHTHTTPLTHSSTKLNIVNHAHHRHPCLPAAPFGIVTLASSGSEGGPDMGAMRLAQTAGYASPSLFANNDTAKRNKTSAHHLPH